MISYPKCKAAYVHFKLDIIIRHEFISPKAIRYFLRHSVVASLVVTKKKSIDWIDGLRDIFDMIIRLWIQIYHMNSLKAHFVVHVNQWFSYSGCNITRCIMAHCVFCFNFNYICFISAMMWILTWVLFVS